MNIGRDIVKSKSKRRRQPRKSPEQPIIQRELPPIVFQAPPPPLPMTQIPSAPPSFVPVAIEQPVQPVAPKMYSREDVKGFEDIGVSKKEPKILEPDVIPKGEEEMVQKLAKKVGIDKGYSTEPEFNRPFQPTTTIKTKKSFEKLDEKPMRTFKEPPTGVDSFGSIKTEDMFGNVPFAQTQAKMYQGEDVVPERPAPAPAKAQPKLRMKKEEYIAFLRERNPNFDYQNWTTDKLRREYNKMVSSIPRPRDDERDTEYVGF